MKAVDQKISELAALRVYVNDSYVFDWRGNIADVKVSWERPTFSRKIIRLELVVKNLDIYNCKTAVGYGSFKEQIPSWDKLIESTYKKYMTTGLDATDKR